MTDITLAGDGTTVRNVQVEFNLLHYEAPEWTTAAPQSAASNTVPPMPTKPVSRTLGVHAAVDHTADSQFRGWINRILNIIDLLARSPLSSQYHLDLPAFAAKIRGAMSDHASDQKLLVALFREWKANEDRKQRGERALKAMPAEERLRSFADALNKRITTTEGWDQLLPEDQSKLIHSVWDSMVLSAGDAELKKLTPEERSEATFFIWVGCCMHKDLNAVKWGVARMSRRWEELGLMPPVGLANKSQAAGATTVVAKGGEHHESEVQRGAVKLTSIAGSLFGNRDHEKGFQDTYLHWIEALKGRAIRFPDTSNTRYGSHCDAAIELLENLEFYIDFLKSMRDAKTKRGFTNMEANMHKGLCDEATLTELSVLAVRAVTAGHPYIKYVRGTAESAANLGPFHERIKAHVRKLRDSPDLLLNPGSDGSDITFMGEEYDKPKVMRVIQNLAPHLPHLKTMISEYFTGELEGWERFTKEWEQDGEIAKATPEQLNSTYIPPTNDRCEGALGETRKLSQGKNMTSRQRSARLAFKNNKTHEFAEAMLSNPECEAYVRAEARARDASGAAKAERAALRDHRVRKRDMGRERELRTAQRNAAKAERLAGTMLCIDEAELQEMSVKELGNQVDKWRAVEGGKERVPPKSRKPRDELLQMLKKAIEWYFEEGDESSSEEKGLETEVDGEKLQDSQCDSDSEVE